ncbi:[NiFe]-hydrogenase assembly chaperone HybE [Magnetococcus sp. PR-3]|uniref:[NiFe]-hydrogenase assembly chaperone HybE n=1 Tax=Magnetococcus sp. PR-3 TaxID=3120355 RepID=UPI002FCE579F
MDAQALMQQLEATFTAIEQNQMQGLPLLNPMLHVEAVGFQRWQEGWLGVVITPWLMNLMWLPDDRGALEEATLGDKQDYRFPERSYTMLVNEFEGVGRCWTFSVHSPMSEFPAHDTTVARAEAFLEVLLTERDVEEEEDEALDEARIQRILSTEDIRSLYEEEQAKVMEEAGLVSKEGSEACPASQEDAEPLSERVKQPVSRRDLLTGLRGEAVG